MSEPCGKIFLSFSFGRFARARKSFLASFRRGRPTMAAFQLAPMNRRTMLRKKGTVRKLGKYNKKVGRRVLRNFYTMYTHVYTIYVLRGGL